MCNGRLLDSFLTVVKWEILCSSFRYTLDEKLVVRKIDWWRGAVLSLTSSPFSLYNRWRDEMCQCVSGVVLFVINL